MNACGLAGVKCASSCRRGGAKADVAPPPRLCMQVLNAMLLACAGHTSADALAAMRALLAAGAVCDTWAPNGSSALMLAASADCAEGVGLLLDHAASPELQDALGRWAAAATACRGRMRGWQNMQPLVWTM